MIQKHSIAFLYIQLIIIVILMSFLLFVMNKTPVEHMNNITNHTNKSSIYVKPDHINKHQIINAPYDITSKHIVNNRNSIHEDDTLKFLMSKSYNFSYIDYDHSTTDVSNIIYEEKAYNQLKTLQLNSLKDDTFKMLSKTLDMNKNNDITEQEAKIILDRNNIQTILEDTIEKTI